MLQAIRSEHEIVPAIEEWRELTKLKSTYLDAFPELIDADGRLRTTFNQVTAATGRLSSTNPNLQNIPIRTERGREIRACFVAEPGSKLISADYSQVELRLLAHIAGEDVLKEIFRRGEDVHTATAEQILGGAPDPGTRSKAKMVNYGIVYGLSAFGLADRLQIPQRGGAGVHRRATSSASPRCARSSTRRSSRRPTTGYVTTLFGRIRRVPELRSRQLPDASAGRAAGGEHGDPGHGRGHHQGRDGALPRRAARRRAADAAGAPDPRRAAVRGAGGRGRGGVRRSSQREMAGAFELDPPLGSTSASGDNWLAAK